MEDIQTTALNHIHNKDFAAFSAAVKSELSQKLNLDPFISSKKVEAKRYKDAEQAYKSVSSPRSQD
jgi:hypothetical protein